jgi:hypothetical protein
LANWLQLAWRFPAFLLNNQLVASSHAESGIFLYIYKAMGKPVLPNIPLYSTMTSDVTTFLSANIQSKEFFCKLIKKIQNSI